MALYSTFRHTVQEVYLYTHCKCQRTKKKRERKKNYELHMFYVLISLIFQLWVLELAVSQFFGHLNCVCASYTNRLKKNTQFISHYFIWTVFVYESDGKKTRQTSSIVCLVYGVLRHSLSFLCDHVRCIPWWNGTIHLSYMHTHIHTN